MDNRYRISDEQIQRLLSAMPDVEPPADLTQRIMAQVASSGVPVRARTVSWRLAAAAVLGAVGAAVPTLPYAWPWLLTAASEAGRGLTRLLVAGPALVARTAAATQGLLEKTAVAMAGAGAALRNVAEALADSAGASAMLLAMVTIGLQWVLWAVVRRRAAA